MSRFTEKMFHSAATSTKGGVFRGGEVIQYVRLFQRGWHEAASGCATFVTGVVTVVELSAESTAADVGAMNRT